MLKSDMPAELPNYFEMHVETTNPNRAEISRFLYEPIRDMFKDLCIAQPCAVHGVDTMRELKITPDETGMTLKFSFCCQDYRVAETKHMEALRIRIGRLVQTWTLR